jgi:hypothetical protein
MPKTQDVLTCFERRARIETNQTTVELKLLRHSFMHGIYVAVALGILGLLRVFFFSMRPLDLFANPVIWKPSGHCVPVVVPLLI